MIPVSLNVRWRRTLATVAGLVLLSACQERSDRPAFDGQRAFAFLEKQVSLGPRNPESPGWAAFQKIIAAHFDSLHIECHSQPFAYFDYLKSDSVDLVNWVARFDPAGTERVLIAAHYDCRPRAEYDPDSSRREEPIPGANDGASGTAVLMHLAELLAAHPPSLGVDLVFFDGEDYGPPGRIDQYLLGSAYFARHKEYKYRWAIIIDMIGDRDLRIYREKLSQAYAPAVNDRIWKAADKLGLGVFVDSVKHEILDDHLSLLAVGIPAVTVIDFDYPYWHTLADTPDKCTPASLEAVGRMLVEVIYAD